MRPRGDSSVTGGYQSAPSRWRQESSSSTKNLYARVSSHAQKDRKDGSAMSWTIGIDLCVSALNIDLDMSARDGKGAMLQTNVRGSQ
jgi:hypothetical protein